jgi:4-amino-4-deoxy-L-arabinose transferase-like glycosyltransferase
MENSLQLKPNDPSASWALLIIFGFGAFLRIYNFWTPDLWLDEYVTWWVLSPPTWTESVSRAVSIQGWSPVYFFILKLFTNLYGFGNVQLRILSVFLGVATLFAAYKLAREIFTEHGVALVSVAVLSLNDRLIWLSQNARPYALALFLTILSFLFFLAVSRRKSNAAIIGYVLTTTLLIYSHFLFGPVVIAQMAILVFQTDWRQLFSKLWLTCFFAIGILCLPLVGQFTSLYERRQSLNWLQYRPEFDIWSQLATLAREFSDPSVMLATIVSLVIAGIKPFSRLDSSAKAALGLLLLWFGIPFIVLWSIAALLHVSLLETRYIILIYPAACYLLSWFLLNSRPTDWRRWFPVSVFVVTTAGFSLIPNYSRTGTFSRWTNSGWSDAARVLALNAHPKDYVVFHTGLVEADRFALKPDDPLLLSYVSWPIVAHLPSNHGLRLLSLPYNLSEQTEDYLKSVEERAGSQDQVWVAAEGKLVSYLNNKMTTDFGFQVIQLYTTKGKIVVALLKKRGLATTPH